MSEPAGPNVDVPLKTKTSDLPVRTVSAAVMLAVAGGALWLGGWWWTAFVALIAVGVLWEWRGLTRGFTRSVPAQAAWNLAGFVYIGGAAFMLILLRSEFFGYGPVLGLVGAVVATDIGAYFAGRAIGGPKIAPRISPSKTWAGLAGGICGAALAVFAMQAQDYGYWGLGGTVAAAVAGGAIIAVLAQAGDFFESWMKRRAGVKDSGHLIPGHGGLFDRVDGLLAVCFVGGIVGLLTR